MNSLALSPAGPAAIQIASPATDTEWDEARTLIEELWSWLESLSGVAAAAAQDGFVEELRTLPSFYAPPEGRFFVATVDGRTAGGTGIVLLSPGVAEIKRVYVRPEARGLGLASRLLDAALDEARAMDVERIVLETHAEFMQTAVGMYSRRGFYEIPDYTDLSERVPGAIAMEMVL